LLPMKVEPGVGSVVMSMGKELNLPLSLLFSYHVQLLVGFWQGRLIIEDQNTSSIMGFFSHQD
jgi:hypothetical protein